LGGGLRFVEVGLRAGSFVRIWADRFAHRKEFLLSSF